MKLFGAILIFGIAAVFAVLSVRSFHGKGFVLNNVYLYATKESRRRMDKQPLYRQSAIVFILAALIFAVMGFAFLFENEKIVLLEIPLEVGVLFYAVVSSAVNQKYKKALLKTRRLVITEFTPDMANDVYENSHDEDVFRFVPDEYFDTVESAEKAISYLITRYGTPGGPFVYPILVKSGENIGYVELSPLADGNFEVGYHIANKYKNQGFATEATKEFLPRMAELLSISAIYGICDAENTPSQRVLEKCGFVLQKTENGKNTYLWKL